MADTITSIENLLLGFTNSLTNASVGLDKEFKTRPELKDLPFEYHIPKMSVEIGVNLTTTKGRVKTVIFSKKEAKEQESINSTISLDIVAIPPRNRPTPPLKHEEAMKPEMVKEGIFVIKSTKKELENAPYLGAVEGGAPGQVFLNKSNPSLDEHFTMYKMPDESRVFKTDNGNFLTVKEKQATDQPDFFEIQALPLDDQEIGDRHKFIFEALGGDENGVGLKSVYSERYLRVGNKRTNYRLFADKLPLTVNDTFLVVDHE